MTVVGGPGGPKKEDGKPGAAVIPMTVHTGGKAAKLARLKKEIASGTYAIAYERLAKKLLDDGEVSGV